MHIPTAKNKDAIIKRTIFIPIEIPPNFNIGYIILYTNYMISYEFYQENKVIITKIKKYTRNKF
ncbi:hypothetical protein GCM10008908_22130 [Clostridium subterminale]|uniref:Uncharacterized protein n=1 Tax=Clostridium subterminale TaxID=1550 RepID=A0ABN1KQM5_CLOSU